MLDLRPVGYVVGLMVMALGLAMILPMLVDIFEGRGHWEVFAESAILTTLVGALVAISCRNGVQEGLTIQQTFLLTTGVWVVLPVFGAMPLMLGATEARFVDAFFEAMSGLTTTGSTVLSGLEDLPKGLLLWRGILQWLGGYRNNHRRDGLPSRIAGWRDADIPHPEFRHDGQDFAARQ